MSQGNPERELPENPERHPAETVDALEERTGAFASEDDAEAADDVVTGTDADEEQGDVSEPPA